MDYILSNIFVALYTDGFCVTKEDPENEGDNLKFEDATGTGMGEGEGAKDVSDQIQDEDQLLGSSDKVFIIHFGFYCYAQFCHISLRFHFYGPFI